MHLLKFGYGFLSWEQAPVLSCAGVRVGLFGTRTTLLHAPVVQLLRVVGLPPCSSPWSPTAIGPVLRVFAIVGDGDTTGSSAPDSQGHSLQSTYSPTSVVKGNEAGRSPENELGVFTKFIDDLLLQILNNPENPVRQTVLMTDGTDDRPYRLLWPNPSLVFHLSPGHAYRATSRQQIEIGMKVPRSCLLQHISVEFMQEDWGDEDLVDNLVRKGYTGNALSAWAMQMSSELSKQSFLGILALASCLLMKGSRFLGVIPCTSIGTSEEETRALLTRWFVGEGFSLELHSLEELASKCSSEPSAVFPSHPRNLHFAFIAQQQRLSDAQVEMGRIQMELAEEVDEEGFEDSW